MHRAPVLDLHAVHQRGLDLDLGAIAKHTRFRWPYKRFVFRDTRNFAAIFVSDANTLHGEAIFAGLQDLCLIKRDICRSDQFTFKGDRLLREQDGFADSHNFDLPIKWQQLMRSGETG